MQDFRKYSYRIRLEDLEKVAREATNGGYNVTVIINGEYYDIGGLENEQNRTDCRKA